MLTARPNITFSPIGLSERGKVAIIIDGQFGSCGKGLAASYAGYTEHFDLCISNASPNAGHTWIDGDGKAHVTNHFSVAGIINKRSMKYLSAGSIIHPRMFLDEIQMLNLDPSEIFVHPRAAVVEDEDVAAEHARGSSFEKLASTRKGAGAALARKIRRNARLAGDHPELRRFSRAAEIHYLLDQGVSAILEIPQGTGLAINSGFAWPYLTSREITVAGGLADAQIHPCYLGKIMMCVRCHPIRVGNIEEGGQLRGTSGPFWPDSKEITWDEMGVERELTTVTRRVRRVATFSEQQYRNSVDINRPDFVFLNFVNYFKDEDELAGLLSICDRHAPITHLGFGPAPENMIPRAEFRM